LVVPAFSECGHNVARVEVAVAIRQDAPDCLECLCLDLVVRQLHHVGLESFCRLHIGLGLGAPKSLSTIPNALFRQRKLLVTLDGQFTPGAYQPLRFTFLVWIMVILGGSGNNWGSVLGGFFVWFFWVEAEPLGAWLIDILTIGIGEENALRQHLIHNAAQMRLIVMGLLLLVVMRFMPLGLLPERRE